MYVVLAYRRDWEGRECPPGIVGVFEKYPEEDWLREGATRWPGPDQSYNWKGRIEVYHSTLGELEDATFLHYFDIN